MKSRSQLPFCICKLLLAVLVLLTGTAFVPSAVHGKTSVAITGSNCVAKGKKVTLKANKKVSWKSSNTKVATVSSKGTVKGVKAGKATITATLKADKTIKKKWNIRVFKNAVKTVSIKAPVKVLDLNGQKTVTLKAGISPAGASNAVTWKSSNPKVATVNSKGKVTAISVGKTVITASASDGSKKKASETIQVNDTSKKPLTGTIKVWAVDNTIDFTKAQIQVFQKANPDYAGYTFQIEAVNEADVVETMVADVSSGADIFIFPQDQLARLVADGAASPVSSKYVKTVREENTAGSVKAATQGNILYAYPLTSDNGFFLYYDKSVIKNPGSLEQILADCEASGRAFYFEMNSGWYQAAFFFATGANLTYDTDKEGNFTACHVSYASKEGLVALKEMIELKASPAFRNGSSISSAANIGAIVDGTWDSTTARERFGSNYACAKLPVFTGYDGKTYQMSGFGGFKLLGVKPQTDENRQEVCHDLAAFLSGCDVQLARFEKFGWGPSNLKAQASSAVKENAAFSALAEQLQYCVPQGQYPPGYWISAASFGNLILDSVLTTKTSDEDLMKALADFEKKCITYTE